MKNSLKIKINKNTKKYSKNTKKHKKISGGGLHIHTTLNYKNKKIEPLELEEGLNELFSFFINFFKKNK